MIYLFWALFAKDLDLRGLGSIRVGEMRLLEQQRKPSVLPSGISQPGTEAFI